MKTRTKMTTDEIETFVNNFQKEINECEQETNVIDVETKYINNILGSNAYLYNAKQKAYIDRYHPIISSEHKTKGYYNKVKQLADVISQQVYYLRDIYYGTSGYGDFVIPPFYKGCSKNSAFIIKSEDFMEFCDLSDDVVDWDRPASNFDEKLSEIISRSSKIKLVEFFDFSDKSDVIKYFSRIFEIITGGSIDIIKKKPTFSNIERHWYQWNKCVFSKSMQSSNMRHYGFKNIHEYSSFVRNCFMCDIVEGKSYHDGKNNLIVKMPDGEKKIQIKYGKYQKLWENLCKIKHMNDDDKLMLYVDAFLENESRRKGGDFYTREDFVKKSDRFIAQTLNPIFGTSAKTIWDLDWNSGNLRYIGIATGRGILEWNMPKHVEKYSYLMTLRGDDCEFMANTKFTEATIFPPYNYLVDDIIALKTSSLTELMIRYSKAPKNFIEDIIRFKKGELTFIINVNPPYFVASDVYGNGVNEEKELVDASANESLVADYMKAEKVNDKKLQEYVQFLYRIRKEFSGGKAFLCLYSPVGFLTYGDYYNFRKKVFDCQYLDGYIFSSKTFRGTSSSAWNVLFSVWDLSKSVDNSEIRFSVERIDNSCKRTGQYIDIVGSNPNETMKGFLNNSKEIKNVPMPTTSSAFVRKTDIKALQKNVTEDTIFCIRFEYNYGDIRYNCILSTPCPSARSACVTPTNFKNAMVGFGSSATINVTQMNLSKVMMKPYKEIDDLFVMESALYAFVSNKNNCIPYENVEVEGRVWEVINNNMFPFTIDEVSKWDISRYDFKDQMSYEEEDRFFALWLNENKCNMTPLCCELMNVIEEMYKLFYENVFFLSDIQEYKITRWDVGFMQVKKCLEHESMREDIDAYERAQMLLSKFDKLSKSLKKSVYDGAVEHGIIRE